MFTQKCNSYKSFFLTKVMLSLLSLMICFCASAQVQLKTGQFTGSTYSGSAIESFDKFVPQSSIGNHYLNENWFLGEVDLFHGTNYEIKEVPIKFNIVSNRLELKLNQEIKTATPQLIKEFTFFDSGMALKRHFVNASEYNSAKTMFLEVLFKGENVSVLKYFTYDKLAPDYNAQFDTGSKEERIVIKEQYFLYENEKLIEMDLKNKFIKKRYSENEKLLKSLKNQRLKLRTEDDIVPVFTAIDNF